LAKLLNLANFGSPANCTRTLVSGFALTAAIAILDWKIEPNISFGFLYLFPILLMAPCLSRTELAGVAALCAILREAFGPFVWGVESLPRLGLVVTALLGTGLFVRELARNQRMASEHLRRIQAELALRREAEEQLRELVERSPAAILTLDASGKVLAANLAADQILGAERGTLAGESIMPYLPVLASVAADGQGPLFRTMMECRGRRRGGEAFLAHVGFSTYQAPGGSRVAAILWDASESLQDRENLQFDSTMTTLRILAGAVLHEVRNLSMAATVSHASLKDFPGLAGNAAVRDLGSVARGLERMAASELRIAAPRAPAAVDLAEALEERRIVIQSSFQDDGLIVHWEIAPGLPQVWADNHSLLQILSNVARSSHRAMLEQGIGELTVTAWMEPDHVAVRFCHAGRGAPLPERLFQPFRDGAGETGLELYVSRVMAQSFGGDLLYESQRKGSCLAVKLSPAYETTGESSETNSHSSSR